MAKMGGNFASRTTSSVFHQFSWNLAQMFALGCRCARHIFLTGRKCVAMVTAYYGKKWGENLASWTTSSVFERFSSWWNLAQMFASGCRCARCIFWPWQKVRCHGNITTKNLEKTGDFAISTFLKHLEWNFAHMLAVRWCVRYILWQWWKVRYHGNSISGQENGENFVDWTTTLFRHLK